MERPDNVRLAREFVQKVQAQGRLDLFDRYIHPDFRDRTADPGHSADREGARSMMAALHEALSGIKIEIVHCFEHDETVATNKVIQGRQVGIWLGQAPNGNHVVFRVMDFLRFEDGQIIEHWSAVRAPLPAPAQP